MNQTIVLTLPEETVRRYREGATVARKDLEEFLAERLEDTLLPLAQELPQPLRDDLSALETLDDEGLWKVARARLTPPQQRTYSRLLRKNQTGELTPKEQGTLRRLGDEARRLTLKKAHAYMLLKWRGHCIPSLEELQDAE